MDYYGRMAKALSFIEANLRNDLRPEDVAAEAFFSRPHMYRVFRAMTGLSIKDYVSRRRLSVAAESLLSSRVKVIDLAFSLRYDSPETFLRAFRRHYGVTPSEFRKTSMEAKLFMPMSPDQTRAAGEAFAERSADPRYAWHRELALSGRSLKTSMAGGKNLADIPPFWDTLASSGFLDMNPDESFYAVYDDWVGEDDFTLYAGKQSAPGRASVTFSVPAARYAVFTLEPFDATAAASFWTSIYGQWLPETGIERTDRLVDFERYSSDFRRLEIFIPIKE
jgi:AraC family transcriptional regulator